MYHPQNIPDIGNAYRIIVHKIVSEKDNKINKRVNHLFEDLGKIGWAEFETNREKEVEVFLTLTIFSETHKNLFTI